MVDSLNRSVSSWLLSLLCVVLAAGTPVPAATGPVEAVCSDGGMVVSACPIASGVGARILRRGGNAVDAAIALELALAVTYPRAGNIGGGGFMLVRMRDGESRCIDYRERAPSGSSRDMYLDGDGKVIPGLSTVGHLSSGVPGTVAGLYLAHTEYGTIPWRELVEPAVRLAREGFPVSDFLAFSFHRLEPYIDKYKGLETFMNADGSFLTAGDTLRQPELARTLERIALDGPEDFYRGETARLVVREMERGGGLIDLEDLTAYEAIPREPVRGSYRGFEILSAPPPSSGGIVLLEILNIVEGFPIGDHGFLSEEAVHLMVEAEKRAYRDRALLLGDPDRVNMNVSYLSSKDYADDLRDGIKWAATDPTDLAPDWMVVPESEETTHYSVIDREGNVVSTTTTLNGIFGSMVVVEGAGFLLNNEMDDFSIKPGVPNMYGLIGSDANAIEPGKRMLSSMTPTILLDEGEPYLVLGSPGGGKIITTVAQIVMNIIDFGMSIADAVDAPRFHHQWIPDKIEFERRAYRQQLVDALEKRGQSCFLRSEEIGDAQVIGLIDSIVCGVADGRGNGKAIAEREYANQ